MTDKPTKEEQERAVQHMNMWVGGLSTRVRETLSDYDRRALSLTIAKALMRARLKILPSQRIDGEDE